MSTREVVVSFSLKDDFSAKAEAISRKTNTLRNRFKTFSADLKQMGVSFDSVGGKLQNWAGKMKWVSGGLIAAGGAALLAAGNFEELAIRFEVLTGSASKGRKLLNELRELSLDLGPFGYEEVMSAAEDMLNFGYAVDDVIPKMKMLATLGAGANISLDSVVRAAGMAQKTGRVERRSLMPLRKLGIEPLLEARLGMSHSAFKKAMGKGQIPASVFFEVLADKAKTYGDILARIDGTTSDMMGDTKELTQQIAQEFGILLDKQVGANSLLGDFNKQLREVRKNLVGWAEAHPGITKFALAIAAILIVATPVFIILASIVAVLGFLASIAAATGIAFGVLFGWVLAGFAAIVAGIVLLIKYWDEFLGLLSSTRSWFEGTGWYKALEIAGVIDTNNNSHAQVDVTVAAEKGSTAKVASKSSGVPVGVNMVPTPGAMF